MLRSLSNNGVKGKHRLLPVLLMLVVLLSLIGGNVKSVYAVTATKGIVKCRSGIVRQSASTSAACVFCVKEGDVVYILSETKGKDDKTWYEIQVSQLSGFIRSDLVKKTNETITITVNSPEEVTTGDAVAGTEQTNQTTGDQSAAQTASTGIQIGKVTGSSVNVRENPVDGKVVTRLTKGSSITTTKAVMGSDGNSWYAITCVHDKQPITGFICGKYVDGVTLTADGSSSATTSGTTTTTVKTGTIKGTSVRIRDKAVNGNIVSVVNIGTPVTILSETTGSDGQIWYQASLKAVDKDITGYVRSDLVNNITESTVTTGEVQGTGGSADSGAAASDTGATSETKATIKGTSVRIRDKEVNGSILAQLNTGHDLKVISEVKGSDNYTWYQVSFDYQGSSKTGYVRSDLVNLSSAVQANMPVSDSTFESMIAPLPDSYKNNLRALHAKYPNWRFEPVKTGLNWDDAVNAECVTGKNLTSINSISSWKSTNPQAYNWQTDSWYGFDGGAWASASPEVIKYYLDPRNFLDESGIFMFETLEYQDYQSETGVNNVLAGSFMSGSYTDTDGVTRSYASTFVDAGRQNGINPYHLASRCLQEQGTTGNSGSVTGTIPGYENLFNFFNIGAYAASGRTATENGLIYASGSDENYSRPWNSRYRSILGSAKYVSEKYVKKGQNTLYFQKFNVVNSSNGIYSHQYMTNISAASSEAARLRKAYTDLNVSLVFKIPYYENMPSSPCEKPISSSNPNNYLSSLWVDGYDLSPGFSCAVDQYTISVPKGATSINIGATCMNQYACAGGIGSISINESTKTCYVVCKAQNGTTKTYTINLVWY